MHNVEASMKVLGALKDMGISLAIDDFGTGYSSLAYPRRFPIGTLWLFAEGNMRIGKALGARELIEVVTDDE